MTADLTRPESLRDLPGDVDAVVSCAGAGERSEAAYRAVYVDGLRGLGRALGAVPRWIFTSSTSVYGQTDGGWVDEASPTLPTGFNGRIVREGEDVLRELAPQTCAIRFGGIYGPGRTRLLGRIRRGEARYRTSPPHWTNRIHRDDCAGVLEHLLGLGELPSVLVGVDEEPATEETVFRWLATRFAAPAPRPAEPGSSGPGSKRCRNARLLAAGYRFAYPSFREGYGEGMGESP